VQGARCKLHKYFNRKAPLRVLHILGKIEEIGDNKRNWRLFGT